MMKQPTNSATTANVSMKLPKNPRARRASDWSSAVIWAPVTTSMPRGTAAATRSRISVWEIPSSAMTST